MSSWRHEGTSSRRPDTRVVLAATIVGRSTDPMEDTREVRCRELDEEYLYHFEWTFRGGSRTNNNFATTVATSGHGRSAKASVTVRFRPELPAVRRPRPHRGRCARS